tara:strand:- start:344 stop:535 length:192 start_codon:yes stop_codon:yes gene_type:complete
MKELTLTQLEQTSEYINNKYDLDTWVNSKAKSIWLSVWNKELSDAYDVEMSKEQIREFYNENK